MLKLFQLFRKQPANPVPVWDRKNIRIEIAGPRNEVLYTVDFRNPNRALDMLEQLLEDHWYIKDGPFKLNYYKIDKGYAECQTSTELAVLPPRTVELFNDYNCQYI